MTKKVILKYLLEHSRFPILQLGSKRAKLIAIKENGCRVQVEGCKTSTMFYFVERPGQNRPHIRDLKLK